MKRINLKHIGLFCAALCFLAGLVVNVSQEWKFALAIGGCLMLLAAPLCMQIQKTQALQAKAGVKQTPGIAEYGTIIAFVALLVFGVFQFTQRALESAISSHISSVSDGPSF